jgi:hypothetical protein
VGRYLQKLLILGDSPQLLHRVSLIVGQNIAAEGALGRLCRFVTYGFQLLVALTA